MDDNIKEVFSKNLCYWLERRGKTQADLYRRMEISSATASDWCNAKKIPRTDKLIDLASWLMIEIGDLLYAREHEENDILNDLLFRIKDDEKFKNLLLTINSFDSEKYEKIVDYVTLLQK
ncbi:MAG: helix-turn-helix transcriptional regulator [Clostridiales bacterium]|nr:helix-turn-helix transcriptional regulator [Clostridiales bacterium]